VHVSWSRAPAAAPSRGLLCRPRRPGPVSAILAGLPADATAKATGCSPDAVLRGANCVPGGVRMGGAELHRPGEHCRACARRYLAESACAGMCVNLCKAPVQQFFTQELGMPLTMCARRPPGTSGQHSMRERVADSLLAPYSCASPALTLTAFCMCPAAAGLQLACMYPTTAIRLRRASVAAHSCT